jgi:hypothetical protein
MTVQQHAPRLVRFGPAFAIPTATLVIVGAIVLIVAAAIGTWLFVQPFAIPAGEMHMHDMLRHLRETIPGGGFI